VAFSRPNGNSNVLPQLRRLPGVDPVAFCN
jgi:hypothetical protein